MDMDGKGFLTQRRQERKGAMGNGIGKAKWNEGTN
jgi:hypothetical protein